MQYSLPQMSKLNSQSPLTKELNSHASLQKSMTFYYDKKKRFSRHFYVNSSSFFHQKKKGVVQCFRNFKKVKIRYIWYRSVFSNVALCTTFTILLTLWNSEQKNGLLIKLFCFSSDFDETRWSCSYPCVLQFHQVSSKSD